ncbi:MAG: MerR family transcriptional regulator [Desulfosalsimonadaceae bacterium]
MAETGPSFPRIPDKLYFRIGEVTEITELAAYVLRFWESEFPEIRPRRTESGQRLYRKSDVKTILLIKHLLYDKKFTIQGARQHLHRQRKKKQGPHSEELIAELKTELRRIRDLLNE